MAATTWKTELFAVSNDATSSALDDHAALYIGVDMHAMNLLFGVLQCHTCNGRVNLVIGDHDYGLAVKLIVVCNNCGDIAAEWSLQRLLLVFSKLNFHAVAILEEGYL